MSDQLPVHKRPKDDTHGDTPPPPTLLVDLPPPPDGHIGIFAPQTHEDESKEAQHMSVSAFAQQPFLSHDIDHEVILASLPASPASTLDPLHPSSAFESDEEMFIVAPPTVGADEPNAMENTISEAMPSSVDRSEEMCEPGVCPAGSHPDGNRKKAQPRAYKKKSENNAQDDEKKEALLIDAHQAKLSVLNFKQQKANRSLETQKAGVLDYKQRLKELQSLDQTKHTLKTSLEDDLVDDLIDVKNQVNQQVAVINGLQLEVAKLKSKVGKVDALEEENTRLRRKSETLEDALLQLQAHVGIVSAPALRARRRSSSICEPGARRASIALQSVIESGADEAEIKQDDE